MSAMLFQSDEPAPSVSNVSVGQFLMNAMEKHRDLVAMIDAESEETTTYDNLLRETKYWINIFKQAGLKKGDIVGLVIKLHPRWVSVIIALLSCGATVYGCRMMYEVAVINELSFVGASFVIVDSERYPTINGNNLRKISNVKLVCLLNELSSLVPGSLDENFENFSDDSLLDEVAFIFRSSGTTGEPKATISTHQAITTCAKAFARHMRLKPGQVNAVVLGFVHAFPMVLFTTFLGAGIKTVVLPDYSIQSFLSFTTHYKINRFFSTSVISMRQIADEPILPQYNLSSLTTIIVTGTIFPATVLKQVQEKLGVAVLSNYGSTECLCISGAGREEMAPTKSVGRLLPGVQVRIIDVESGNDLGHTKPGIIYVKSLFMLKSYYKDLPEKTFENGWFNTGDIGAYDEAGWLYVFAKVKDAICQNGSLAIYPAELERVLMKHPKIKDVAVVGVPHPDYQEIAKAFVVRNDNSLSETEVLDFFSAQVEGSFQLMGVTFLESLPRIGLGKILRRELKKLENDA